MAENEYDKTLLLDSYEDSIVSWNNHEKSNESILNQTAENEQNSSKSTFYSVTDFDSLQHPNNENQISIESSFKSDVDQQNVSSMVITSQNFNSILKLNSTSLVDEGNISNNCEENMDLYLSKILTSSNEQPNQPTESIKNELMRCLDLSEIRSTSESINNPNSIVETRSDSGILQTSRSVSSELSSVNILNLAFKESTGVDLHSKSSSSIDIEQQPIKIKAESSEKSGEQIIEKLLDCSIIEPSKYTTDVGDKLPVTVLGNGSVINLLDVSLSQLDHLSCFEKNETQEKLTYQKDEAYDLMELAKLENDEVNDPKDNTEYIIPSIEVPIIENNENFNDEQIQQQSNEVCHVPINDVIDQINTSSSMKKTANEDYGKISCSLILDDELDKNPTLLDLTNTSCNFLLSASCSQSDIVVDSIKSPTSHVDTAKPIDVEIEKNELLIAEKSQQKNNLDSTNKFKNNQHEQQQPKKNEQMKIATSIPIAIRSPLISLCNKNEKQFQTRIVTPKFLPSNSSATSSDRKIRTFPSNENKVSQSNRTMKSHLPRLTSLQKSRLPISTSSNLKSMKLKNSSGLPILKRKN
ncbi:uncharacterized protein LOC113792598 [Dermatophagoides pteronyssinus]|uniref:uncharacterized protein LOC113792598 n=1 Tax=Dermatophagoides pteronyssinus TaxID=6956 RepID=UPI003F667E7C